jgi:hypothetical protein
VETEGLDIPGDDPWDLGKGVKVGYQDWDSGSDDRLVEREHLSVSGVLEWLMIDLMNPPRQRA